MKYRFKLLQREDKVEKLETQNKRNNTNWTSFEHLKNFNIIKHIVHFIKNQFAINFSRTYLLHLAKHTPKNSRKCKPIYNTESRSAIDWTLRLEVGGVWLQGGTRELSGVIQTFQIIIVVIVTQLCTFVKTHHIAHLKWVPFTVSKLYLNKIDIKKYILSSWSIPKPKPLALC